MIQPYNGQKSVIQLWCHPKNFSDPTWPLIKKKILIILIPAHSLSAPHVSLYDRDVSRKHSLGPLHAQLSSGSSSEMQRRRVLRSTGGHFDLCDVTQTDNTRAPSADTKVLTLMLSVLGTGKKYFKKILFAKACYLFY